MSARSQRILGAVVYLAFLAIFVECALQAFYYLTAGDFLFRRVGLAIYAPNEHSGVFNRPKLELDHRTQEFRAAYYTNAQGFRVPDPQLVYSSDKPDDTYRVMLLGPSFAFGWGVDYQRSFAAVLEQALEARGYAAGRDIEVINAGVPSLPPAPQLRWYEHAGRDYRPDLLIQFVYGSMAVSSNPEVGATVNAGGYLVSRDHSAGRRIRERVKKLATVFYAWVIWSKLDWGEDSPDNERAVLGAGREMVSASNFDLSRADVIDALHFYRKLHDVVQRDGTELLVVYFPLSYVIHAEDVGRWRHLGVTDVAAQIAFDADFAQHLNDIDVPTVNLTGALQEATATGERLYFWLDIHWTEAGNAITARAVADELSARGVAAKPGSQRSSRAPTSCPGEIDASG